MWWRMVMINAHAWMSWLACFQKIYYLDYIILRLGLKELIWRLESLLKIVLRWGLEAWWCGRYGVDVLCMTQDISLSLVAYKWVNGSTKVIWSLPINGVWSSRKLSIEDCLRECSTFFHIWRYALVVLRLTCMCCGCCIPIFLGHWCCHKCSLVNAICW